MTFLQTQIPERKLVRIQEKGQVTLPTKIRQKLGLKKGDMVTVEEAENGILITPQEVVTLEALERIGAELKKQGLTLEDLIESGREIRGQILEEKYGIDSNGKGKKKS